MGLMTILRIAILVSVDPSIGRIDKSALSQQSLMELLIDGIDEKELICGSANALDDISAWKGMTFSDINEVVEIQWNFLGLRGSIALQWLPFTTQKLVIAKGIFATTFLEGTLDLTCLPKPLKYLQLSSHHFEGNISLSTLPSRMEHLDVSHNNLSGSLDLTALPSSMQVLRLSWNNFSGVVDLSTLPKSLADFHVAQNTDLEGVIHLNRSHIFGGGFAKVGGTKIKVVYND